MALVLFQLLAVRHRSNTINAARVGQIPYTRSEKLCRTTRITRLKY